MSKLVLRRHFRFESLETRRLLSLQPVFVKDINPGVDGSSISEIVDLNGVAYFVAYEPMAGDELWRSDGTAEGTWLVHDIRPGHASASPHQLTVVEDAIYFVATDEIHGEELWRSDGTSNGTSLVLDIAGPQGTPPKSLTEVGDALYFTAGEATSRDLWRSDGTAAGTIRLRQFSVSSNYAPAWLTDVGGRLYFSSAETGRDMELWVSDGTVAGTKQVKAIRTGPIGSFPSYLVAHGDSVFFQADDGEHGAELWVNDGTTDGTRLVQDTWTGSTGSSPWNLVSTADRLYFSARTEATGEELWMSDGSDAGTMLVADLAVGTSELGIRYFGDADGTFFFSSSSSPRGLWTSNGTPTGTTFLGGAAPISPPVDSHGTIYWSDLNDLFHSNGTAEGTAKLDRPLDVGEYFSPTSLGRVGRQVFFGAGDPIHGHELWMLAPGGGDADADGRVDLDDLNLVRNNFGRSGSNIKGDVTDDGIVDLNDLNLVRNSFGNASERKSSMPHHSLAVDYLFARAMSQVRQTTSPKPRPLQVDRWFDVSRIEQWRA